MTDTEDCLENLSAEHKIIYEKFRSEIKDLIQPSFDDYFIWKWIKATKYDIEKAKLRFEEHLKFRKRYGVDTILKDFELPQVIQDHYSYSVLGFDDSGNIVAMELIAFCDFKGIVKSLTFKEHIKSFVYIMERYQQLMKEENIKTGNKGRKIVGIADLKNHKYNQFLDSGVRRRFVEFSRIMETHYPEMLKCSHLINVPVFFYAWFNVFKKLLDPVVVEKFKIYASGGWMEVLSQTIDPDIIPAFIGGSRTDPDGNPECNTLFKRNGPVPVSCYLSKNLVKLRDDPEAQEVTIRERVYYNHSVLVRQKDSVLSWSFETIDYDIGFAVYYVPAGVRPMPTMSTPSVTKTLRHLVRKDSRDGHVVLVPLERVESQYQAETGELVCEDVGTYLLHFDNTYSWTRTKTLFYKVQVVPPSASDSDLIDGTETS